MPRYFFHIKQNDQFYRDDEGIVMDNLDAVTAHVIEWCRAVVDEMSPQWKNGTFVIEDSEGRVVLEFRLKEEEPPKPGC